MIDNRVRGRLFAAGVCLALASGACGAFGQTPSLPSASATAVASVTPTPAYPEIISPTAAVIVPSATPIPPTDTPEPTPTLTSAPVPPSPCAPPTPALDVARFGNWEVYCNEAYGFGFRYPSGGGAPGVPGGHGRIYLPFTQGTNLSEKYLDVTVTQGTASCSSPLTEGYTPGVIPTESVTFNGIAFTKESGSDAGAGNIYDWEAYSTLRGADCISLSFVLHAHNPGNFPTPPPEYDQPAESAVFSTIVSTFSWAQ